MIQRLGLLLSVLLFANTLHAQEASQATTLPTSTIKTTIDTKAELRKKSPWSLQLDINPIFQLNGSYGVSVIYDVATNLSLEANANQKITTVRDYPAASTVSAKINANALGLRLNFYPLSSVQAGGFYTSIAASHVNLNSEITAENYLPSGTLKKDLNDEHTGRQIYAGYQFPAPKLDGRVKMTSRVGVGYGNGNKYAIRAGWNEYDIEDSVLFDASLMLLF